MKKIFLLVVTALIMSNLAMAADDVSFNFEYITGSRGIIFHQHVYSANNRKDLQVILDKAIYSESLRKAYQTYLELKKTEAVEIEYRDILNDLRRRGFLPYEDMAVEIVYRKELNTEYNDIEHFYIKTDIKNLPRSDRFFGLPITDSEYPSGWEDAKREVVGRIISNFCIRNSFVDEKTGSVVGPQNCKQK